MSETALVILSPCAVERKLSGIILSRLMARGKLELSAAQLLQLASNDIDLLAAAVPETATWKDCRTAAMAITP